MGLIKIEDECSAINSAVDYSPTLHRIIIQHTYGVKTLCSLLVELHGDANKSVVTDMLEREFDAITFFCDCTPVGLDVRSHIDDIRRELGR